MASGQSRYSMVRFDLNPDEDDLHAAVSRDLSFDIQPSSHDHAVPQNALGITVSPHSPLVTKHEDGPEQFVDVISRSSSTSLPRSSTARRERDPISMLSGSTQYDTEFEDIGHKDDFMKVLPTVTSIPSQDESLLARTQSGFRTIRPRYDSFMPHQSCQATKGVKTRRCNHIALTIILLALFSTIFSGIFLMIALIGPRYGRSIRISGGTLTPDAAATLTTVFARLIEMSFVPVVVAYIGQVLARRAYYRDTPRGVTMAEISMRNWIAQPGTMLTNWHSVRYAAFSVLGVIALATAIFVTLYSVAATALVQPQLRFLDSSFEVYQGLVKTQFANPSYIVQTCESPTNTGPYTDMGTNCVDMEHAAMAYHNYYSYMASWNSIGTETANRSERPNGVALVNDNYTISAPWIDRTDIKSLGNGRFINNVTMAMPHVGVIKAGADPINKILQPNEADSATYILQASVPSPMINVLCVTMSADDLSPFVFDYQDLGLEEYDPDAWLTLVEALGLDPYLNGTQFDDVFQWGPQYGLHKNPPIFPMFPDVYNTILNTTSNDVYGRGTVYVLGQGNFTDQPGYSLCQMQAGQTPECSTLYSATSTGGALEAICQDPDDAMQYINSNPLAPVGNATINLDWPNVASAWALSLSLNDGVNDANASNARLLTSFIVAEPTLNPTLPSMAEALAVMAGCTLIEAVTDAPFVPFWNYTNSTLEPAVYQNFNATIRPQQYASGGSQAYQKPFYIILFGVFVMNIWVMTYFLWHRDWYTDFSEPMNLFSLAVNSPPSERLAGCCGAGPSGKHYKVSWKLSNDAGHVYMESQEPLLGTTPMLPVNWRRSMSAIASPFTSPFIGSAKKGERL